MQFGLKTVDLLRRFKVDNHTLTSRDEIDAFKQNENVDTTPQVYIDDQHICGYEELREHLGMSVSWGRFLCLKQCISTNVSLNAPANEWHKKRLRVMPRVQMLSTLGMEFRLAATSPRFYAAGNCSIIRSSVNGYSRRRTPVAL